MWTDRGFLDSSLWYECFYRSCYNHFPEFLCSIVGCVSSGLIPGSGMAGFGENARSSVSCDQNSFRGRVVPLCTPVSSVWKWLIWGDGVAGQYRASFCDALMGIPPPTGWVGQGDVKIVVPYATTASRVLQDLCQAKEDPLITEGSREGLGFPGEFLGWPGQLGGPQRAWGRGHLPCHIPVCRQPVEWYQSTLATLVISCCVYQLSIAA